MTLKYIFLFLKDQRGGRLRVARNVSKENMITGLKYVIIYVKILFLLSIIATISERKEELYAIETPLVLLMENK
jgi:hypothetical protein